MSGAAKLPTPRRKSSSLLAASDEETAGLRTIVKAGRFLEVQEWIASGDPICFPASRKRDALEIAVEQGFHSMVELLASVWPDPRSLNHALHLAVNNKRADLVQLLLKYGADLRTSPLSSVTMIGDKTLMQHVLDNWDEYGGDDCLVLIVTAMPNPLTGLVRQYATKIPDYTRQLTEHVLYFIDDDSLKWIALSPWMGADPTLPVRTPGLGEDEPNERMTPIEYAVFKGKRNAFDQLRAKVNDLNYTSLRAIVMPRRQEGFAIAEHLVELSANVNNKHNGGSSILDRLLEPDWIVDVSGIRDSFAWDEVGKVERWVKLGARFVPDSPWAFSEARRGVRVADGPHAERVFTALQRATSPDDLFRLFNTPKLLQELSLTSRQLRESIRPLPPAKPKTSLGVKSAKPKPIALVTTDLTFFKQRKAHIVPGTRATYDRIQLYDAIWTTPAIKLSKELGMSDVGLAKICKRHKIPRPCRGYWAKNEVGIKQPRPKLKQPDCNPTITIASQRSVSPIQDEVIRKRINVIIDELSASVTTIDILPDDAPLHPCMANQSVTEADSGQLDLRLRRVTNTFLHFLDRLGWSPHKAQSGEYAVYAATIVGKSVRFRIRREQALLTVTLVDPPYSIRSHWQDGKKYLIETQFVEIASWMAYGAGIARIRQ